MSFLSIIAIGFFLGMRHATDPDHVIAVSTIVTRELNVRRSALIGAAWGAGHTMTILAVGGAIVLFRIALPPRVGLTMELAVGVMLIVLGVRNVRVLFTREAHRPDERELGYQSHGDYSHSYPQRHPHSHQHSPQQNPIEAIDRWFSRGDFCQLLRPLIVGIVHGMAGSAAIALLVLSAIPNVRWELVYLAVFGIGTILGMMLITCTIASTLAFGQKRFLNIGRHFGAAAGLISVVFGMFITYQIAFVDGLFTRYAYWVPR